MKALDTPIEVFVGACSSSFDVSFSETLCCPKCNSKLFVANPKYGLYKMCVVCKSVFDTDDSLRKVHSRVTISTTASLTIVCIAAELRELGYDLEASARGMATNYFVV